MVVSAPGSDAAGSSEVVVVAVVEGEEGGCHHWALAYFDAVVRDLEVVVEGEVYCRH